MSTELVLHNGPAPAIALPALAPSYSYSVADVKAMAADAAKSRLFPGIASPEAAFTLMLLCQSEGLHPMQALRRYHIIEGRPSMRADAMQAEFQRQGGVIRWVKSDALECEAVFLHQTHAPEPGVTVRVTFAELAKAGLTGKDVYRKFPAQMIRARVVSQGVRMVLPGVVVGIYTPEEVSEFGPAPGPVSTEDAYPTTPPPPKNDGGRGRLGAYADGPQTDAYREWLKKAVDYANGQWLDRWTDAGGQVAEGIGDLLNGWQLSRHLLKWAVAEGHLQALPEDQRKQGQIDKTVAVLFHRDGGRDLIRAETGRYILSLTESASERWAEAHPEADGHDAAEGSPDPGADEDPVPFDEPGEDELPEPGSNG